VLRRCGLLLGCAVAALVAVASPAAATSVDRERITSYDVVLTVDGDG
jgi:hypothetical protein